MSHNKQPQSLALKHLYDFIDVLNYAGTLWVIDVTQQINGCHVISLKD